MGVPANNCSGRGTLDEWTYTCDCPIGFTGARCEVAELPARSLGDHAIPLRSWVLQAFHDNAGSWRWQSRGRISRARNVGPLPCGCLQQLVAAPFLLERSRLQYMARAAWTVQCVDLPSTTSLAAFVEQPAADAWRVFSFSAVSPSPSNRRRCSPRGLTSSWLRNQRQAYDALRLGVEPSLRGDAQLDLRRVRCIKDHRRPARDFLCFDASTKQLGVGEGAEWHAYRLRRRVQSAR